MVNIIITTKCTKNCPYCFAAHVRQNNEQVMSIKVFHEILKKSVPEDRIKILGGEPTAHRQFTEFFSLVRAYTKNISILSNFLFLKNIREYLVREINSGAPAHFLANSSDLDVDKRINIWANNYNAIYRALYSVDKEMNLSCGTTILHSRTADYYKEYIDFLLAHVCAIERFRIAIPFQGGENRDPKLIINNKKLGNTLYVITKHCISRGITPVLDERIFPCLFDNKDELRYLHKFLEGSRDRYKCQEPPCDIFPDKQVSFCYPLKDKVQVCLDDFDTIREAYDSLKTEYMIKKHKLRNVLPKTCLECSFYKELSCSGVSLCLLGGKGFSV